MRPSRTAGTSAQPVAPDRSVRTALPHHDAMITSGSRRDDLGGVDDAVLAELPVAQLGKDRSPPAISTSSSTQRMPEMSGSCHSSKNTRGRRGSAARAARERRPGRARARPRARRRGRRAPTSAPTMRTICRISATLRWLNTITG